MFTRWYCVSIHSFSSALSQDGLCPEMPTHPYPHTPPPAFGWFWDISRLTLMSENRCPGHISSSKSDHWSRLPFNWGRKRLKGVKRYHLSIHSLCCEVKCWHYKQDRCAVLFIHATVRGKTKQGEWRWCSCHCSWGEYIWPAISSVRQRRSS